MRKRCLVLSMLAQLLSVTLPAQVGDSFVSFVNCEDRVAADPDSWASLCFVRSARESQLWAEAQRRVSAHLQRRPGSPYLSFTLGFLELEGGSLPRAAGLFRSAAEAFASRAEADGETLAWLNLGRSLGRQGLLEETARAYRHAERAAQMAADPGLLARVRVRQAQFSRMQGGDLERAHRVLLQMEHELPPEASYQIWKSLLYERAVVLHRLGRPEEASRVNQHWVELARRANAPYDEATALSNVAVNLAGQPPYPAARQEAIRHAQVALESAEQAGNRPAAVTAHRLLGKLLSRDEGHSHLQKCLQLSSAAAEPPQQAACLFAIGGSLASDDPQRARQALEAATALALDSEDPWTLAYGWAERFRVNWTTLSREEAVADSLAVLDLIEALRDLQTSETGSAAFFTGWTEVYYSLAGRLLATPGGASYDELETAFAVAERLRARVLLDHLVASQGRSPPTDHALAAERIELLREIVRVHRRLQSPTNEERVRSELLSELDVLELDLAEVESRIRIESDLDGPPTRFSHLAQIEKTLASNQALLAFLVAPDEDIYGKFAGGSWLLSVTNGDTRGYRLPGRMELEVKVKTFLELVRRRDDRALELGSTTLYDDLLHKAIAELPPKVDELTLVPDGVLHLLPFSLLRSHPQADPLAARYRLSAVPSATLWNRWRLQPEAPPAVLVLADPEFLGSVAAPADGELAETTAPDRRGVGAQLGRLPYAAKEGRALLRRLGGSPNRLLVGEEASEAFLKGALLEDVGTIHLAAHALVDNRRPERSAVLLAAGGPREDGLLQPREITALELAGKLIVLSACESGSGQVLLGEGVQSLARSFFQAGARSVVASLWRLRDDEAATFFDAFYRAVARGESVATAVAAAQRELVATGAPAAIWAAPVVLGDGAMVPLPGGVHHPRRQSLLSLVLIGLLTASFLVWTAHRKWRLGRAER